MRYIKSECGGCLRIDRSGLARIETECRMPPQTANLRLQARRFSGTGHATLPREAPLPLPPRCRRFAFRTAIWVGAAQRSRVFTRFVHDRSAWRRVSQGNIEFPNAAMPFPNRSTPDQDISALLSAHKVFSAKLENGIGDGAPRKCPTAATPCGLRSYLGFGTAIALRTNDGRFALTTTC